MPFAGEFGIGVILGESDGVGKIFLVGEDVPVVVLTA